MSTENITPIGRPTLPPHLRRDQGINLKVTKDEKAAIKELSKLNGCSLVDAVVTACKDNLSRVEDDNKGSILDRVHKLETRTEFILELLGERVQSWESSWYLS